MMDKLVDVRYFYLSVVNACACMLFISNGV
jgi:hypothetical protein